MIEKLAKGFFVLRPLIVTILLYLTQVKERKRRKEKKRKKEAKAGDGLPNLKQRRK